MFESVEKYLQGKKLRYENDENQYSIEFADYGTCSYLCKGWKIQTCPDLAECEELAGEEWVDIKYRFRGIEDDALFQQQWIELKQELIGYKYDNITMFDKFTNSIFTGTPEISTMECLSYEDTPADVALDNTIVLLADLVQKLMARYEAAYLHLDPERENGPYSESNYKSFLSFHMPEWIKRDMEQKEKKSETEGI